MNKTTSKVFLLLGVLVGCFIAWQLIFNNGGILRVAYNAVAGGVNAQYAKAAGAGKTILPVWNAANVDTNGQAFDIDTN